MKTANKPINLTIMIPVYNEEKTILKILKSVTSLGIDSYEVIVVDDASHDKSAEVIKKFSDKFKSSNVSLRVVTHKKNSGKGAAIKTALQLAKGEFFVVQDADLEYDPVDIPDLLKFAKENDVEVVYGSRFKGKIQSMPKPNYFANKFYNFVLRRLYKTQITDMHTCYKMVKTNRVKGFNMTSDGFDYATELISKILKTGLTVYEVPISFNGRTKEDGKKIDFKDGIECIYKLIKFRFTKI